MHHWFNKPLCPLLRKPRSHLRFPHYSPLLPLPSPLRRPPHPHRLPPRLLPRLLPPHRNPKLNRGQIISECVAQNNNKKNVREKFCSWCKWYWTWHNLKMPPFHSCHMYSGGHNNTCSSSSSSSSSWSFSLSVSVTMTITSCSSWSGVSLWLRVTSWSIEMDCEAEPSSPSSRAGNSSVCRTKQFTIVYHETEIPDKWDQLFEIYCRCSVLANLACLRTIVCWHDPLGLSTVLDQHLLLSRTHNTDVKQTQLVQIFSWLKPVNETPPLVPLSEWCAVSLVWEPWRYRPGGFLCQWPKRGSPPRHVAA